MLELPSASPSASTPNPAVAAAMRAADKEGVGFQGRLREALDTPGVDQAAPSNGWAADPAALRAAKADEAAAGAPMLPQPADAALVVEKSVEHAAREDWASVASGERIDASLGAGLVFIGQQEGIAYRPEAGSGMGGDSAQAALQLPLASQVPIIAAPAMQATPTQVPAGDDGLLISETSSAALTVSMTAAAIQEGAAAKAPQPVADGVKPTASLHLGAADVMGKAPPAPQFTAAAQQEPQAAPVADAQALPVMDQKPASATLSLVPQAAVPMAADPQLGPVSQLDQMAKAQGLAAGSQQAGQVTSLPLAGQGNLAPAQPGAGQQSEASSDVVAQHAIISSLVAGQNQAAAQPAKPAGAPSAAPKAVISTPAEVAETSKSAMPNLLLAQSFAAGEAMPETQPVLAPEAAEARLQATSIEAPKTTIAKHTVENEINIIPGQGFGFAVPDGASARADAPVPHVAAREGSAPPPPVRQLAPVLVSLAFGGGNEALTISLDPGELGRVEVSIGQGKEAGQVRIIAERPETLALLQRDQRELDRALTQAGLGDMARSLSFSLASDQGRQQQHHAAQEGANRFAALSGRQEAERPLAPMPAPPRASTSLIDLAV